MSLPSDDDRTEPGGTERTDPTDVPVDPAALRAQVAVLEHDLAAREAQVSAMREQYETVLSARDDEGRELRTDGGRALVGRIRRVFEL